MVRFKNRYLLCVIEHDSCNDGVVESVNSRSILSAVRTSVQTNFGDISAGKLSSALTVKFWSPALRLALIRSSRDHFRTVWAAISMVTFLDCLPETVRIRLRVVHVGGTIRSCQKSGAKISKQLLLDSPQRNQVEINAAARNLAALHN